MPRRKKRKYPRHKPKPPSQARQFADTLDAYEETMGEGAAMALLCEQEGMDMEDGYLLLADLPDAQP